MEGAEFHESPQRVGLKAWSFNDQLPWLRESTEGIVLHLERRQGKQPINTQQRNSNMKS